MKPAKLNTKMLDQTRLKLPRLTKEQVAEAEKEALKFAAAENNPKRPEEGKDPLRNQILNQLVRNTSLLSSTVVASILACNNEAPLDKIVMHLLIAALDVESMIALDSDSTLNEKRIARQNLAVAFLSALAVAVTDEKQPAVTRDDPAVGHREKRQ
jgi:hypothetical protein